MVETWPDGQAGRVPARGAEDAAGRGAVCWLATSLDISSRRTALAILVIGGFAVIFIGGILWATRKGADGHH
jgi:hypothetical protein